MVIGLVVVAIVIAIVGGLLLSEATAGVGVIGVACLFGILARMQQAREHHADLSQMLGRTDVSMPEQPRA